MTNQEALKKLKDIQKLYPWGEDSYKVIDYAIRAVTELPKRRKEAKRWRAKALEQEPLEVEATELQKAYNKGFEDCRRAVLEKAVYTETEEGWCGYTVDVDYIKSLPYVTPQSKTGHWINDGDTIGVYYCSECGGYVSSYDDAYCKYCGAKMIDPQESEE